jgi:hypothetical protein
MKKSDLLEAWKKVCKYPENNDAIGCINDLLENLPDDEPKKESVTVERIDGHEFEVGVKGDGYGATVRVGEKCLKCGQNFLHYPNEKCKGRKKPEWEEELTRIVERGRAAERSTPSMIEYLEEFVREEMKKLGKDIELIYGKESLMSISRAVNEALKERGVE